MADELTQEPAHPGAEEQGQTSPLPSTGAGVEGNPIARYRRQIEAFEGEDEPLLGKLIRWGVLAAAYLAPVVCALLLGQEFGDAFGQGGLFFSLAIHVLSIAGELIITGLALAVAHTVKHLSDRSQMIPRLLICGTLFLLGSGGSALALGWLLSKEALPPFVIGFRMMLPLLIDIGSLAIVATLDFQSLEGFLARLHRKAEAIQRLSEGELRLRAAEQEAANRQREYEEYRAMRARNEEVLLRMLEIQSRGALAALERQERVIESEAQPTLPPAPPAPALPEQKEPGPNHDPLALWQKNGHQARR